LSLGAEKIKQIKRELTLQNDKKILIVEDEVLTAMSLQHDLKKLGYGNCSYVTTGEKALSEISRGTISLVIMDIGLAGKLTGIETAEKVIDVYHIPVIISSGYDYDYLFESIAHLGKVLFLKKPISKTELIKMIENVR